MVDGLEGDRGRARLVWAFFAVLVFDLGLHAWLTSVRNVRPDGAKAARRHADERCVCIRVRVYTLYVRDSVCSFSRVSSVVISK